MRVPVKITPDRIRDSIVQIFFQSSVPFDALIGVFYTTLVNTSVPPTMQPGVMIQATFTGPFVSTLTFKGAGTFPPGGAPYSQTATAVSKDKIAVNGVYHVIDKVLLPQ